MTNTTYRNSLVRNFTAALGLAAATLSHAAYPEHPITIVVPYSAGGPTDRVARDFAEALRKQLGQPIVIDNAAGAGGNIGATKVARAPADGYTLLLHNIALATAPALYRSLQYKALEDFEYLGMVADVPMTLIGRRNLPGKNMAELRRDILASPGKFTIGNAGIGSAAHLCGILLQSAMKADMIVVPYKGTANAMTDLLAGQIDLLCDQTTNTTQHIAAGKVATFGVTSQARLAVPALADKPTVAESGFPGFSVVVWHGLYAPSKTPAAITQRLGAALKGALKDPEFVARQQALGAVIVTDARTEPNGHKAFVAAEIRRWTPLIKATGLVGE
jgi:tripartite-type tricarboxylate transporter receptor subunit TctC